MKKSIVILLVCMVGAVQAQLPIQHCGDTGFLYSPECNHPNVGYSISYTCSYPFGGFTGSGYTAHHDTIVYGVAAPLTNLVDFPYLWVYLLKARFVDTTILYGADSVPVPVPRYRFETVRKELYCFLDRPPVPYAQMEYVSRGDPSSAFRTPIYDFYFNDPCGVDSGEIYYVGVVQSPYNVYNHWLDKTHPDHYSPWSLFFGVCGGIARPPQRPPQLVFDSVCGFHIAGFPSFTDPIGSNPGPYVITAGIRFEIYGFLPIVRPPQGEELNPPHVEPIAPRAVTGVRLDSVAGSRAVIRWDAAPASEWGPTGVNVDMYQLSYAEYGYAYAAGDTVNTPDTIAEIPEDLDSTKYYKARCRARCHHRCDIHDTVVWGPWSEEFCFYTGSSYYDTLPLECAGVEGFHYVGERGGMPSFGWTRGTGQKVFEIEYAPERMSWTSEATDGTSWTMPPTVHPSTEYRVRVRAKCIHRCYVHDTVMWGPWSSVLRVMTPETTGMAEGEGGELFALEPNPARGSVTVRPELSAERLPAVLTLTDMQGREVLRREVRDVMSQQVDLGGLVPGTYMVTLTCRDRTTCRRRLVVE